MRDQYYKNVPEFRLSSVKGRQVDWVNIVFRPLPMTTRKYGWQIS